MLALFACSADGGLFPCKADSGLSVVVAPGYAAGTVTTRGSCTAVHCVDASPTGCKQWEGTMTSSNVADICFVTLIFSDGRALTQQRASTDQCGAPQGQFVEFSE